MELPSDVIPWCAVVDVIREPRDYVYRFWGTARARFQGHDYTGTSIRCVEPERVSEKIWREYELVVEKAAPVYFVTSGDGKSEPSQTRYHFLRLPFGESGAVRQILAIGMHEEADIRKIQEFYGFPQQS